MPTYSQKLRDPRWQRKRLEIFQRDQWTCKWCKSKDRTLNVHHHWYNRQWEPWEYPDHLLVTLCEECHLRIESLKGVISIALVDYPGFRDGISDLYAKISTGEISECSEEVIEQEK